MEGYTASSRSECVKTEIKTEIDDDDFNFKIPQESFNIGGDVALSRPKSVCFKTEVKDDCNNITQNCEASECDDTKSPPRFVHSKADIKDDSYKLSQQNCLVDKGGTKISPKLVDFKHEFNNRNQADLVTYNYNGCDSDRKEFKAVIEDADDNAPTFVEVVDVKDFKQSFSLDDSSTSSYSRADMMTTEDIINNACTCDSVEDDIKKDSAGIENIKTEANDKSDIVNSVSSVDGNDFSSNLYSASTDDSKKATDDSVRGMCALHTASAVQKLDFHCGICDESFTTKYKYKEHVSRVHDNDRKERCLCSNSFQNSHVLVVHESSKEASSIQSPSSLGRTLFKEDIKIRNKRVKLRKSCPCDKSLSLSRKDNLSAHSDKTFSCEDNLTAHSISKVHGKKTPHKCSVCNKYFSTKGSLTRHNKFLHQKKMPYKCSTCDITFSAKSNLTEHLHDIHKQEKPHKCSICGKSFSVIKYLKTHIQSVHEKETPHKCSFCDKSFSHRYTLISHMSSAHDKEKPHKCDVCDKTFSRKRDLTIHVKTVHENDKPFQCSTCGKMFSEKSNMMTHVKGVHEKDKRYKCPTCGRSFSYKSSLSSHISSAHDVKKQQYTCSICNKSFLQKCNLTRHNKTHEKKSYKCSICNTEFTLNQNLKAHVKSVHEKDRSHNCSSCDKSYSRKDHLSEHIRFVHIKEKRHECSTCDMRFARMDGLRNHMRTAHKNVKKN